MKIPMEETAGTGDGDFLVLPPDSLIQVAVDDISMKDVPGRDGKQGWTKLEFRFKIVDMPDDLLATYGSLIGTSIWGSVGARLTDNPDNKLRQWTEAILDIGELNAGFELDTDILIGRKARAQIGNYPRKTGGFGQQVVGLLPLVSVGASAAPTTTWDDPPF